MKAPNRWQRRLINRIEVWHREDVKHLILTELREIPTELRLLGPDPTGPFGRSSWAWVYVVEDRRTGESLKKGVYANNAHSIIRRIEGKT